MIGRRQRNTMEPNDRVFKLTLTRQEAFAILSALYMKRDYLRGREAIYNLSEVIKTTDSLIDQFKTMLIDTYGNVFNG
jgi:hypothetical protein